jgi:GAF domain-containing protein
MIVAAKPANERERLKALWSCELLDTEPEDAFDAITKLAANLCGTPIAVVSLIDEDRQWFKSQCGLGGVTSTHRDVAFCSHALLQSDILEVPDAAADPRFADNPLVSGEPRIRFYAGMPLIDPAGMTLGTLCVIDREPRTLTQAQRLQLAQLARVVVGLIATRIRRSELEAHQRVVPQDDKPHSHFKKVSEQLRAFAKTRRAATAHREPKPLARHTRNGTLPFRCES